MSLDSNQQKIDTYELLGVEEQEANFLAHYDTARAWLDGNSPNPSTCEEALRLFQKVPPVRVGGESIKTKDMSETERTFSFPLRRVTLASDWLEDVVASTNFANVSIARLQRIKMGSALLLDRQKPYEADSVEKTVDDYHLRFILEPATMVAGVMMNKRIKVTYARQTGGVATDLRVCDDQETEENMVNYIVAEDKRSLVWLAHESKLLDLIEKETFPEIKNYISPPGEVRMCIQIWVQMHKFEVFYGKIFSPCGVIYVRRVGVDHLQFSRIYHDLDDDVRRTACLIMETEIHPLGHYTPSLPSLRFFREFWPICALFAWFHLLALRLLLLLYTLQGNPSVAVGREGQWSLFKALQSWHFPLLKFPAIFSKYIAAGASGEVWLSNDGKYVIKIFTKRDVAENEAEMLWTCQQHPQVSAPTFHGLYSDGWRFGLVTRYAGSTIGPLDDAPQAQRQQLLMILRMLHNRGIHHHDVRPANVVVDKFGVVTLIDFDRAERVHGDCSNCTDLEVISSLETCARLEEREISPYRL